MRTPKASEPPSEPSDRVSIVAMDRKLCRSTMGHASQANNGRLHSSMDGTIRPMSWKVRL